MTCQLILRDDSQLFRWNISTNEPTKITDYPELSPIDMQWIPRGPAFAKHNEIILITGADGRFHIVNRNGRIERSVDAHKGAVLVGRWSYDGAGLLTGFIIYLYTYIKVATIFFIAKENILDIMHLNLNLSILSILLF